jgi:ribonuclease P protein component
MGNIEPDHTFPKSRRVTKPREFDAVFKAGGVVSDHMLVLHLLPNQQGETRLGISISKRVGSAPLRNRWKRLIREAYRLNQSVLPVGFDFVARPRKGAQPDFEQIQRSFIKLAARAPKATRGRGWA